MKSGNLVQVSTKKEKLQGRLMPSKNDKLILKLSSGYNLSIDKKNIKSIKNKDVYNIAEFAVGLNNKAKIIGNILEDEKVYGTAHVALGNNKSYGGKIDVPIHLDGVFDKPTVFIDNKKIMDNGKLIIYEVKKWEMLF